MEENVKPWWALEEFNQTITLADGTVLNGTASTTSDGTELWIWIPEGTTTFADAFMMFQDPAKTASIRADLSPGNSETYEGFTQMNLIRNDPNRIVIRMRKGT